MKEEINLKSQKLVSSPTRTLKVNIPPDISKKAQLQSFTATNGKEIIESKDSVDR